MKHPVFARLLVIPVLIAILFLMPRYFRAQEPDSISDSAADSMSGSVSASAAASAAAPASPSDTRKYIKWVDFDVTAAAMRRALQYDVDTYDQKPHLDWIELLAWLGARYGGDFSRYRQSDLDGLAQKLTDGASMDELTKDMKYYGYYLEAYGAVLGGMVGTYQIQIPASEAGAAGLSAPDQPAQAPSAPNLSASDQSAQDPSASDRPAQDPSAPVWVTKYGLKAFSPIAKNYPYQDFDDFGVARSYGFRRQHLGHDMMGQVGTPVFTETYMFSPNYPSPNCSPLSLK